MNGGAMNHVMSEIAPSWRLELNDWISADMSVAQCLEKAGRGKGLVKMSATMSLVLQ